MIIVLMGVTGSGKTTVGEVLAAQLGWRFCDADDLHPSQNVEKMRRGIPLTDADRVPWLEALREFVRGCLTHGESAVLACSALKDRYREYLLIDEAVKLVYLRGEFHLIEERLSKRRGHYMNPKLLQSQFDTLEEPKDGITVDVAPSPETVVRTIRNELGL